MLGMSCVLSSKMQGKSWMQKGIVKLMSRKIWCGINASSEKEKKRLVFSLGNSSLIPLLTCNRIWCESGLDSMVTSFPKGRSGGHLTHAVTRSSHPELLLSAIALLPSSLYSSLLLKILIGLITSSFFSASFPLSFKNDWKWNTH